MRSRPEQEWYVVAAIFTLHVLVAMLFFAVWIALAVLVFLAVAWVVGHL